MKPVIEYDRVYHIYNRGNNYENIFLENHDYQHFLKLYSIYIDTIADTYAWCLMKNHFHFLLRIRDEEEIGFFNSSEINSEDIYKKWETHFPDLPSQNFQKKPNPSEQFKHLFATYTKWFNKKYLRRGSLFTKNFERIPVDNEKYYTALIVYIHNNPVKHGFSDHAQNYPWSSYRTIVSGKPTKIKRAEVLSYFHDLENFEYMHRRSLVDEEENLKGLMLE